MPPLIQVQNLVKHYPAVKAVNGVSFDIVAGRCFGLLGPNGAGKTTTVEMLEGIVEPTEGNILYRGQPLGHEFRNEAGIMFQSTALQDFITVAETLRLFGSFYPRTLSFDELVEVCSLQPFLNRDTRKLSGGQRQRVLLAIALVNDPDVIFLDEPTTGLDPQARRNFWDLVDNIKSKGKTVILTTHYMEEAHVLCDEIAIMDHGEIIATGTPRELLDAHFNDVILHLPNADVPDLTGLDSLIVRHKRDGVEILTADVNLAIRNLLERGASLENLRIRSRDLEDLFLELTGKALRQ